jgi:methylase of polypeptide subunit release factors
MLTGLVPVAANQEFLAVDMACGAGTLSEALLLAFGRCRVLALDGSP